MVVILSRFPEMLLCDMLLLRPSVLRLGKCTARPSLTVYDIASVFFAQCGTLLVVDTLGIANVST